MSRKLATVREVNKLVSIEGADFIELAIVDGWQCIVKKGEFKEGDLGIYFEIDSMLPIIEPYAFLGKTTNDKTAEGYRIRTMKMRKQLSQGLMLPMTLLAEPSRVSVGTDVTKELGVWLYEPLMKQGSASSNSRPAGLFPPFLKKTDQERLQNVMSLFDTHAEDRWEASVKLDGSSMTIWHYDKAPNLAQGKYNKPWKNKLARFFEKIKFFFVYPPTFGVCSRNINLKEVEGNAFWDAARELDIEGTMRKYKLNMAIQGELIGPKIQKNHEGVVRNEFWVFDVFDIQSQKYLPPALRRRFLDVYFPKLKQAPILKSDFSLKGLRLEDVQNFVSGKSMNGNGLREGCVFKNMNTPNLSFKCISNKYLLKYED